MATGGRLARARPPGERHGLRVLIDCIQIRGGGGLQVALAFLHKASPTSEHEWHAAVSREVAQELSSDAAAGLSSLHLRRTGGVAATARNALWIARHERRLDPDVTFTAFGPAYWRARSPHVQGFARPWMLYPRPLELLRPAARRKQALLNNAHAWFVRRADHLIVETDTVRERLERYVGVPSHRISVVRNTYSPAFAEAVANQPPAPDGGKSLATILVLSAYYVHKNLQIIPRVAERLRRSVGQTFEFLLTLPADGGPWRRIHEEATSLGVGDLVRTLGIVPHKRVAELYASASAAFLPTLLECSTAVYPESFVAGVPLATSDIDFARELCGNAAEYFDPYSPEDAARALERVLTDDERRDELVANGRVVLRTNYVTPEEKWQAQLQCLRVVAEGGKRRPAKTSGRSRPG